VVEIVTPSTAPKYFAASPLVMVSARMTMRVATMPLNMFTRTGVPYLALITPRNRGPAPS
jgi:hypothetical protein